MNVLGALVAGVVLLILAVGMFAVFAALPTMWLWNWLMPELFGLKTIGFWQSFGLLLLSGFLLKSGSTSKTAKA